MAVTYNLNTDHYIFRNVHTTFRSSLPESDKTWPDSMNIPWAHIVYTPYSFYDYNVCLFFYILNFLDKKILTILF
ncbi:hypothetical protein SAMN02927921_03559 [Sinomicrobium oceani]|uniref:Uncharacterized protein n=1 Tax=Sinomicrobium oceani TaxID=1150368 RepID=A0A1K1RH46_9FLAO|nr:hypothetical protein SAMN02927921_03559 [Sinomicrobium oceani]